MTQVWAQTALWPELALAGTGPHRNPLEKLAEAARRRHQ